MRRRTDSDRGSDRRASRRTVMRDADDPVDPRARDDVRRLSKDDARAIELAIASSSTLMRGLTSASLSTFVPSESIASTSAPPSYKSWHLSKAMAKAAWWRGLLPCSSDASGAVPAHQS